MGQVKGYLEDALERLQMSWDEVQGMSLVELNELLEQRERSLEQAKADIQNKLDEQEWDVDVDENGPFIYAVTKES